MSEAPEITDAIKALVKQLPVPDRKYGGSRWSAHDLIDAIVRHAGGAYGLMLYAEDMIERIAEHAQNNTEEAWCRKFVSLSDEEQFDIACALSKSMSDDDNFWAMIGNDVHDKAIEGFQAHMEALGGK